MANQETQLVFKDTFEGMWIRGVNAESTASLAEALRREGVDLGKMLPAYPLSTWKKCLAISATTLYPKADQEEAYRQLGRQFIDGFFQTMRGRAMVPLLKLLGAKRILERLRHSFRAGNNFSETRLDFERPGRGVLWINDHFGHPAFAVGLMEHAMHVTGTPTFVMKLSKLEEPGASYEVSWVP